MSGENLGSVYYTVDANVGTVLDAKKQVAESTDSMVKNFKGVDTQMTKMSSSVKSGMNNVSRGAGQAGIQIQQFIGQIQGGQSAILAFSQQSTDLGFVLGFPLAGAIAGIAASVAGIFLPSLFKASDAAEKLEKSIERVSAIATLSVDGVVTFGDAVLELSRYSEEASKQLIKLAIEQNEVSKIKAGESLYQSLKDISSLGGFANQAQALREIGKAAKLSDGQIVALAGTTNKLTGIKLDQFSNEYRNAGKSVLALQVAVDSFKKTQSDATAKELLNALDGIKVKGKFATDEARDLATEVFKLTTAFFKGEDLSKKLAEGIDTVKNSSSSLVDSLKLQVATLGASDRAIALHMASLRGATQAQYDEINTAYDAIEAHDKNEESVKKLAIEEKKLAAQRKKDADDYNKQTLKDLENEEKKRQAKNKSALNAASSAAGGLLNPTEQAIVQYQQEQDAFKAALDLKQITEDQYNEARLRSNLLYVEKLKEIDKKSGTSFIDMLSKNGASLESFQASAVGTMASIATGAQDGQEAIRGLAQAILTQMVGALIQMGISALIGQTTATAGAIAAGATIATAMAPAAALTSLATAGANSTPAGAGIAAVAGIAEGVALSGARLYGGYTAPNSMYKVNESGKAEMFSDGKNDFLMTGNKGGNVTSANDLAGQQKETVVNVNNYGSSEVDVQTRTEGSGLNRREVINIIVADYNSRGQAFNALKRNSNLKDRL